MSIRLRAVQQPIMSISYTNKYQPPKPAQLDAEVHLHTPPEEYDVNWVGGPVGPVKTDRLLLLPFIPSLYAPHMQQKLAAGASVFNYLMYLPDPTKSLSNYLQVIEKSFRSDPTLVLYAIFDLTKVSTADQGTPGPCALPEGHPPLGTMAGTCTIMNTSLDNRIAEIGHIQILPHAQRTHVATHMCGALLNWCFAMPNDKPAEGIEHPPGLAMRRMQWQTSSHNIGSQRLGLRMGHKFEGVQRNLKAWNKNMEGAVPGRAGDGATQEASRDTWWGAATWKDWVEGGQENIAKHMARRE